ncbi:hypothetical protein H9P43_005441 [Blastocladiella emersonii ATCC 22665]|nr:hypothetical protein H9P43_005441 [Blastocladiella emersonii ATCC 22665]
MTASIKLLSLLLLALVATSANAQSPLEDCVKTFDANKDCFTAKSTNDAAKFFKVDYKNYYKVVSVTPAFGAPSSYALVIRGAPKDALPTNVNATFEIPVKSVGAFDTTSVPYLELLGKRAAIAAASNPEYVSSACFQKLVAAGTIKKVDEKNQASATSTVAPLDAIFSGIGATPGLADGKWVTQSASSDPGAFNRAEWLEYFAQWFGLEGDAQKTTTEILARYTAAKEAAKKAAVASPLKVAWVSYSAPASFNGNKASWSISAAAYKKDLVTDAGATMVTPSVSTFSDVAEFRKQLTEVDVVINESFKFNETLSGFAQAFGVDDNFKFMKNKQVYGLDKRVNPSFLLDWFESALVFPNVVLLDLMSIVNPNAVKGVTRTYLRNLDSDKITVVTADQCQGDVAAPLSVQGPAVQQISSGNVGSGDGAARTSAAPATVAAAPLAVAAAAAAFFLA